MMKTHTPGPWTLNDARSTRVDLIDTQQGHAVGEIVWVDVRNPADARLIAAAPELLAALETIVHWGKAAQIGNTSRSKQWTMFETARAAIARAIGEQA